MHGVILEFNQETGKGLISGSDENRYTFTSKDWKSNTKEPIEGAQVDFEHMNNKRASNIYIICTPSQSTEDRLNEITKQLKKVEEKTDPRTVMEVNALLGLIGGIILICIFWSFN